MSETTTKAPSVERDLSEYTDEIKQAAAAYAITVGKSAIIRDTIYAQLLEVIEAGGGVCDARFRHDRAPTLVKTRVIVRNQQLCRIDRELAPKHYAFTDEALIQLIEEKIKMSDALILSDYAKGALHRVEQLIALAKEKGLPILVDPKSEDFARYAGATIVTPNRKEFEKVVGTCCHIDEIQEKAKRYLEKI